MGHRDFDKAPTNPLVGAIVVTFMRAGRAALLFAVFAIPTVSGIPIGTYENPELEDQQGDVAYGDHYVGPRPIESIDFLRGWVEYIEADDQVAFHTHFVDLSDWRRSTPDSLECRLLGDFEVDGIPVGRLALEWTRRENQDRIITGAYHDKDTAARRPMTSSWNAEFERPGNFTILVPRSDLAAIATDVKRLHLTCDHVQYVPTSDIGFGNSDIANSDQSFNFAELERRGSGPEEEPFPTTGPVFPTIEADKTPAVGIVVVAAAICVVALLRRRP